MAAQCMQQGRRLRPVLALYGQESIHDGQVAPLGCLLQRKAGAVARAGGVLRGAEEEVHHCDIPALRGATNRMAATSVRMGMVGGRRKQGLHERCLRGERPPAAPGRCMRMHAPRAPPVQETATPVDDDNSLETFLWRGLMLLECMPVPGAQRTANTRTKLNFIRIRFVLGPLIKAGFYITPARSQERHGESRLRHVAPCCPAGPSGVEGGLKQQPHSFLVTLLDSLSQRLASPDIC
jgi:hypothetical protein